MSYMHPAALEYQRKRFTRPDAYRFAPPGTPEAKPPGWLDPSATRVRLKEAQEEEARARVAAEQEELERELLQIRRDLADLKFELALRRIFHKYSEDQPRSPKGNPDGGQWTRDAGKVGSEAAFSPNEPGWHDYPAGPNLVCAAGLDCPREEMVDQFARYSLPGGDPSMPVEDGKTYRIYIPGTDIHVGDIQTRIDADGLTIENRTKEGHIFFDGMVTRKLTQTRDGAWYVTTRGLGNNVEPGMNIVNQLVGPEVFNGLDRQMRANIERHHGKGLLDLARLRMDGSGRPRARDPGLGERHEVR